MTGSYDDDEYLPRYISPKKFKYDRFAVLFSIASAWLFAQLLTLTPMYNKMPESTQNSCRTDRAGLITSAPWVYFPYPFKWGSPTFNVGDIFAMLAASFVSLFEIWKCNACATFCYQPRNWLAGSNFFSPCHVWFCNWKRDISGKCWIVGIDKSGKA